MTMFQEIEYDLRRINVGFEKIIFGWATSGDFWADYGEHLKVLIQCIKLLAKKSHRILEDLDIIFIDDDNKFERTVQQYLLKLEEAFGRITFNFSQGILKPETVNVEQNFWVAYMSVVAKLRFKEKETVINLDEWAVFYAYTLFDLKRNITDRHRSLKSPVSIRNFMAIIDGQNGDESRASIENRTEDQKAKNEISGVTADSSLSFIDPAILESFSRVEKLALGVTGKFSSEIRCAAFCELLYSKKHIQHTKTRRRTLVAFAKSRYGMSIHNALASSKTSQRENHKTKKVNRQIPLRDCF